MDNYMTLINIIKEQKEELSVFKVYSNDYSFILSDKHVTNFSKYDNTTDEKTLLRYLVSMHVCKKLNGATLTCEVYQDLTMTKCVDYILENIKECYCNVSYHKKPNLSRAYRELRSIKTDRLSNKEIDTLISLWLYYMQNKEEADTKVNNVHVNNLRELIQIAASRISTRNS